jgi:hypothetical protein
MPEFAVCFRKTESVTVVTVPKTPVNEDDRLKLLEHDVWMAKNTRGVQSKTETQGEECFTNNEFRLGVL